MTSERRGPAAWLGSWGLSVVLLGVVVGSYVDLRARLDALARGLDSEPGVGTTVAPLVTRPVEAAPPAPAAAPPELPPGWRCAGRIAQGEVQAAVARHGAAVFACYDNRVARDAAGVLELVLKVGPDGHVAEARMGGTLRDSSVSDCALRSAIGWTFDRPVGGECAVVALPFELSDQGG